MDTAGGSGPDFETRQASPGGEAAAARAEAAQRATEGPSISDNLTAVYASARQAFADFVELVTLELHRAGITFMWMLAWSTFAVLLVVTAWLGLMAGLALWIISHGYAAAGVVLGIALANLIGGAAIMLWCVKSGKDMLLPATRRQLRITAAQTAAEAKSP